MEYTIEGLKEFEAAIRRNPEVVRRRTRQFIADGITAYKTTIWRNPWRMGGMGGGAPRASNTLAQTHIPEINDFEGSIRPDTSKASYAPYVVFGTYKMPSRDYLEYTKKNQAPKIKQLEERLLREIIDDLAK